MGIQTEQIDKRLVLEELRRNLDKLYEAGYILDGKLKDLLGLTSLIVAIAGTLQLSSFSRIGGWPFWIVLVISLALYARIFLVAFRAISPRNKDYPMTEDRDTLEQLYIGETEEAILLRMIGDYLDSIKQITDINSEKSDKVQELMKWIFALVVVMLIAMPISLAVAPFASPIPTP